MTSLGILAHFDPDGRVAGHVLRHVDALREVCDHVLVVTSASLVPEARAALSGRAELIERANEGYDFASWQAGLRHVGDWERLDRVVIANDSVVGPLVPYPVIVDAAVRAGAPWWGITFSREREPHMQSYVLGFEPAALRHPAFAGFWAGLTIPADREEAIEQGELRLSQVLSEAGLSGRPYFVPTVQDDLEAKGRRARLEFLRSEAVALEGGQDAASARERAAARARTRRAAEPAYNPMNALWDRALDGRLPFVKLETLRDDPYLMDPHESMLRELEEAFPREFEGVREHLDRVRPEFAAHGRQRDPERALRVAAPKAVHLTGPWETRPTAHDDSQQKGAHVDGTTLTADDYGDDYYAQYLGPAYDPSEPHWQQFFGRVASRIVDLFHPATFLDVGCAMGILVGNMRELGVDAEGVDHSAYAISKADPRAVGHLRVVDLLQEPLEGHWDVISCIEVLEHLPSGQVDSVIANLCSITDTLVFSSTPDEFNEGTHINVRPPSYWAAQFADHGLFRRFDIDATFLSRDAIVYQRREAGTRALVSDYETALWVLHRENIGTRDAVVRRDRDLAALRERAAELTGELAAAREQVRLLEKRIASIEGSTGYRVANKAARTLGRGRKSPPQQ